MGVLITIGILVGIVVLYLLMIMPRMLHRPDQSRLRNWLYAHRGFHDNNGDAPENSLKAFELAVDNGYGIELDIQLSKDGIPVVFHDSTLTRMTGIKKKVSDLTLEELKQIPLRKSEERIPTLQEALDLVEGMVPLIVEFKEERFNLSLCDKAAPILDAYCGDYCMESFNPLIVRWYKKNRSGVIRGQLSDEFAKEDQPGNPVVLFLLSRLVFNFLTKPDFISYHHKYANSISLRLCKKLYKLPIAAWTVKNQYDYDKNRRFFDYIIFDSFTPFHREK